MRKRLYFLVGPFLYHPYAMKYASLIALVSVYFLIFVGSLVRATGSGMGCPDWPKCYDRWVPPTQPFVPDAEWYKSVFEERKEKNERLARFMELLGWEQLSNRIEHDSSSYRKEPVNISKTWVEYLNRFVGVLTGLAIVVMVLVSLRRLRVRPGVFIASFLVLLVTGFQGWLGSLVVSTNLIPNMVSIHMFLALLIVLFIVGIYGSCLNDRDKLWERVLPQHGLFFLMGFMLLLFLQVFLGLRVREAVDDALHGGIARESVLESLGMTFEWHRSMSWLIALGSIVAFFVVFTKGELKSNQGKIWSMNMLVVLMEIGVGLVFQFGGLPAFAQPFHLLFASLLIGSTFLSLILLIRYIFETGKMKSTYSWN